MTTPFSKTHLPLEQSVYGLRASIASLQELEEEETDAGEGKHSTFASAYAAVVQLSVASTPLADLGRLHAESVRRSNVQRERLHAALVESRAHEKQGIADKKALLLRVKALEAERKRLGEATGDRGAPSLLPQTLAFVGNEQQARCLVMEKLHEELDAAAAAIKLSVVDQADRGAQLTLAKVISEKMEILEHEFNAALNVERVNFPTMDGASRSGVQARAAYAASLEEQRLDTLGAIARALRRARLAQEAAERG